MGIFMQVHLGNLDHKVKEVNQVNPEVGDHLDQLDQLDHQEREESQVNLEKMADKDHKVFVVFYKHNQIIQYHV
jgi:hypothetical protein